MAKIFIIDDEHPILKMYERTFTLSGFETETASGGVEALALLNSKKEKPDLILLDVMMPEMNGIEFLERIKKEDELKHIPVVILTNVGGNEGVNKRAMELGADLYLEKVAHAPAEIVEEARKLLESKKLKS